MLKRSSIHRHRSKLREAAVELAQEIRAERPCFQPRAWRRGQKQAELGEQVAAE